MANAALFVGWGKVVYGREKQSLVVFNEVIEHYAGLQQRGEIESFEPVALDPHGGDLQGFILVRGDREKLNRTRYSPEFQRLLNRGIFCVEGIGVIGAFIGEGLQKLYASTEGDTKDLA
jgi:hypothetical protein